MFVHFFTVQDMTSLVLWSER